jgi:hypothetical protein
MTRSPLGLTLPHSAPTSLTFALASAHPLWFFVHGRFGLPAGRLPGVRRLQWRVFGRVHVMGCGASTRLCLYAGKGIARGSRGRARLGKAWLFMCARCGWRELVDSSASTPTPMSVSIGISTGWNMHMWRYLVRVTRRRVYWACRWYYNFVGFF